MAAQQCFPNGMELIVLYIQTNHNANFGFHNSCWKQFPVLRCKPYIFSADHSLRQHGSDEYIVCLHLETAFRLTSNKTRRTLE